MDPLTTLLAGALRDLAAEKGEELLRKGLDALASRLSGEPDDEAVFDWLRERNRQAAS